MNEAMPIPAAQAADPGMKEVADAATAEMPGFYEGGTDELDIRLKMADIAAICDATMKTIEFSFCEKTYGSEHRLVGNSNHASEGQIHLQDQENGARDREC